MDDDAPDDVVHCARSPSSCSTTTPSAATRRASGRRCGSITGRRHPATSSPSTTAPAQHGRRDRRRRRPRRRRRRGRGGVRRDCRPATGASPARAPGGVGRVVEHRRRLRAGAPRVGGRSLRARRPRPRGARRRQPRASAAGCRAACSTRSASGAGSPTACSRRPSAYADAGVVVGVRRRDARARRRGRAALIATELDRLVDRRHHRRRAGDRHRLPHRRRTRWASRTPAPACRASAGCSPCSGGCARSTSSSPAGRRSPYADVAPRDRPGLRRRPTADRARSAHVQRARGRGEYVRMRDDPGRGQRRRRADGLDRVRGRRRRP